jgi:hypothetical protein
MWTAPGVRRLTLLHLAAAGGTDSLKARYRSSTMALGQLKGGAVAMRSSYCW